MNMYKLYPQEGCWKMSMMEFFLPLGSWWFFFKVVLQIVVIFSLKDGLKYVLEVFLDAVLDGPGVVRQITYVFNPFS